MSGIAGIIRFDGAPVDPGLVEGMTSAMSYRGPDGIHHWAKGSVALGQCMLCTTPESLEERQPLTNEDESLVLVMDGRMDNWEELRRELLGRNAVLRDRSDAELVLRSYEHWGQDCLLHIDGDFAIVIWDVHRQTAFCARDRIGNKPFNYHWDGKTLAFSSELHAILQLPWVGETLNEGMLAEFLANEWYSKDETFWNGVMRLVAAHRMEVGANGPRQEQYWKPDLFATLDLKRDEDYIEYYREMFADVVRRMSRSHKPVAYEVSGGLDSSAIFAMAEHLRRDQRLPAPGIEGYTLDFRGDPDADELEYARAVGRHLGHQIHEIPPSELPLTWYRDWARKYREFPGFPNGSMAVGLRSTARARGSRALLAGVGGDEWVGLGWSGSFYAEELAARQWRSLYLCLKTDYQDHGLVAAGRHLFRFGVAPMLPAAIKETVRRLRRRRGPGPLWLSRRLQNVIEERRRLAQQTVLQHLHRRGQRSQLAVLGDAFNAVAGELEERLCSSLGIERRLPFFSQRIVQLAFCTPERFRTRGRTTKYSHRRAVGSLLPSLVRDRTTKADFMATFRSQLGQTEDELRLRIPKRRSAWVEPEKVAALYLNRREATLAGWVEWWLWTLIGCDALV